MVNFFNTILIHPLSNLLTFLFNQFHDLGLAIIILTIIVRLVLLPFFYKSAKDQSIIQRLSPKIKEIQESHKHDLNKQSQVLMSLYKEHKVNPVSSFLLLIIQLPILFALYRVFIQFVQGPQKIVGNPLFLGMIDLAKPNIFITIIVGITTLWQSIISLPKVPKDKVLSPQEKLGRQMAFMMPILTIVFIYFLPSALSLYILVTVLFSVAQQIFINKNLNKTLKEDLIKQNKNGLA